jgi:hypothetical protein
VEGEPVRVEARILENRTFESISATLYYRVLGSRSWKSLPMARRVKAVFTAQVPGGDVRVGGVEYYVEASDGSNVALYPVSAPTVPLTVVTCAVGRLSVPASPVLLSVRDQSLSWTPSGGAFWYRIYRGSRPGFAAGPDTLLTYVAGSTFAFRDNGLDFAGSKLTGSCYYRVTAVDRDDRESKTTEAASVKP